MESNPFKLALEKGTPENTGGSGKSNPFIVPEEILTDAPVVDAPVVDAPVEEARVNEPSLLPKAVESASGYAANGGLLGTALAPENLKTTFKAAKYANDVRQNLGSAVIKGWGGVADFPAVIHNLAAKGVNYATGSELIPEMTPVTQRFAPVKEWYDKNTELAMPKGQNKFVDAATTAAEWGSGGPYKSDLYAGIGAAAGEAITDATGVGWLEEVGGLFGGLKGASGSAASKSDVVDSAAQKLIESRHGGGNAAENAELAKQTQQAIIKGLREQPTPVQQGEWITPAGGWGETTTPISANPTLSMQNPNQTMAELTGNRGLYEVENALAASSNAANGTGYAMRDTIDANTKALSDSIMADASPTPFEGVPSRQTSDTAEAQISALRATADDAEGLAATAGDAATTAGTRFDELPNTAETSRTFSKAYDVVDAEKKAHADEVWKGFDGADPIDMTGVKAQLKDYLDNREMPNEMVQDLFDRYKKKVFSQVAKWGEKPVEPKSIQYVLTKIKDEVSTQAAAGSSDVLTKEIGMFGTQLENILMASPATTKYRAGVEATRDLYTSVRGERVGKLRNSPSIETLGGRFGYKGATGGQTARDVLRSADGRVINASHDNLRRLAAEEGVTPAFMKKYAGYLDEPKFGRLKNEFNEIIAKQDAATTAKGSADKAAGLAKAAEGSTLKKFADDPEKVVDGLLKNGKANTKQLKSLLDDAVANGTEKSFKNLMNERIKNKMFKDKDKVLPSANSASADSFLNMRDTLVEAGIYTSKEADRIAASLERVRALDLRKGATPAQLKETLNAVEGLTVSAAAVLSAKISGQSSLTMVGALRKAFKARALVKKNNVDVIKRVEEFLISPEKYLDGVKASKKLDENVNSIVTQVMGASIAYDSDGKDEQKEQE